MSNAERVTKSSSTGGGATAREFLDRPKTMSLGNHDCKTAVNPSDGRPRVYGQCAICGADRELVADDTWFFVGGPASAKLVCSRMCLLRLSMRIVSEKGALKTA